MELRILWDVRTELRLKDTRLSCGGFRPGGRRRPSGDARLCFESKLWGVGSRKDGAAIPELASDNLARERSRPASRPDRWQVGQSEQRERAEAQSCTLPYRRLIYLPTTALSLRIPNGRGRALPRNGPVLIHSRMAAISSIVSAFFRRRHDVVVVGGSRMSLTKWLDGSNGLMAAFPLSPPFRARSEVEAVTALLFIGPMTIVALGREYRLHSFQVESLLLIKRGRLLGNGGASSSRKFRTKAGAFRRDISRHE